MTNDDPLLRPEEAADYLRAKPATLQWWRVIGRGPVYIKSGRSVLYRKSALDKHLAAGIREPEAA